MGAPPPGPLAFVFMPRFSRSAFRHGLSERDIQRALDKRSRMRGKTRSLPSALALNTRSFVGAPCFTIRLGFGVMTLIIAEAIAWDGVTGYSRVVGF